MSCGLGAIQGVIPGVCRCGGADISGRGAAPERWQCWGARMQWLIDNLTLIIGTASMIVGLVLVTVALRELRRQRE